MTTRSAAVIALTVVGAIAGALAGRWFWNLGTVAEVVVVAVSAVLGVAVGLSATETHPTPSDTAPSDTAGSRTAGSRTAQPLPARSTLAPEPDRPEPVRPKTNRTWWTETPSRSAAVSDPTPQPGDEADRAVVAQCPRCGDFRLDVEQDGDVYALHCRNPKCDHRWEWRAGAPWPTTVIRRNLT